MTSRHNFVNGEIKIIVLPVDCFPYKSLQCFGSSWNENIDYTYQFYLAETNCIFCQTDRIHPS